LVENAVTFGRTQKKTKCKNDLRLKMKMAKTVKIRHFQRRNELWSAFNFDKFITARLTVLRVF